MKYEVVIDGLLVGTVADKNAALDLVAKRLHATNRRAVVYEVGDASVYVETEPLGAL